MSIKTDIKPGIMGYKDVKIVCPICKTIETIQIPEIVVKESSSLTTIQVPRYRVCEHVIIPFIDKNFNVRGYQKVDYVIISDKHNEPRISIDNISLFSIKINIDYLLFVHLLYAIFHRYRVLILIDDKLYHKKQDLNIFLNYIFNNIFESEISIELKGVFKKKKDDYKEFIILDGKKVRNFKFANYDFSFEESLIKEFYSELEDKKSIINLGNRIREVNILCQKILKIYQQEGEGLRRSIIINHIENTHFVRISKNYLNFLIEVIKEYFNVEIVLAKDLLGDKLCEMWGNHL
ncbi:MAG: hypothetical protein KGD63_12150 [Candidatus Lokiarchaeota archaeon]|nr:hypothetical protein [Candidatus Lokiarchaeota archaeon]